MEWKRDAGAEVRCDARLPRHRRRHGGHRRGHPRSDGQARSSSPSASCTGDDVDNYLNLTAKGGTCVLTAIGSLMDTNVTLNLAMLTLMQKSLQGTIFGGGNPQYDIPQLLSMYKAGKLNLDDMITRQYRLEQINDGYQDMLEGRNIRGVIRYTDADR